MSNKTYFRAHWLHNSPDFPVDLWSELDSDRYETRKLEYFRDGRIGYASAEEQVGDTRLGVEPVPALADIAADPEFDIEEVSKDAFELRWADRKSAG